MVAVQTRLDTLKVMRHDVANVAAIAVFDEEIYNLGTNSEFVNARETEYERCESNYMTVSNYSTLETLNSFIASLDKTIDYYNNLSYELMLDSLQENIKNFPPVNNLHSVVNLKLTTKKDLLIAQNFKQLFSFYSLPRTTATTFILDVELTNIFLKEFNVVVIMKTYKSITEESLRFTPEQGLQQGVAQKTENRHDIFLQKIVN